MINLAFSLWPLVGLVFFQRLALPMAITATIVGGYLLLPPSEGINLPVLPALNKETIPVFSALVLAAVFARQAPSALPGWLPRVPAALLLLALLFAGALGTVATNADVLVMGSLVLPGLGAYDALAEVQKFLVMIMPFILARKFLAAPDGHWMLLLVLVAAGSGYAILALYEIRMSPQLNNMVYGFFPHDWLQHRREDGWRPVVFMYHGLWLSIFLACATLAAFGLWRTARSSYLYLLAGFWLLLALVLSKSLGALVIVLFFLPILFLLPRRVQTLAAAAIAIAITIFPVLRVSNLVPTDRIVSIAAIASEERSRSIHFRFMQEDLLLKKAMTRPIFGWGGWGRARVFDAEGRDQSVTDGHWIIILGRGGWARYIGEFGLLTFATIALGFRWRRYKLDPATAAISVVLTANLIDLIPNSGISPITWLLAGALAGRLELGYQTTGTETAAEDESPPPSINRPPALTYSRSKPSTPHTTPDVLTEAPRFSRFASSHKRER